MPLPLLIPAVLGVSAGATWLINKATSIDKQITGGTYGSNPKDPKVGYAGTSALNHPQFPIVPVLVSGQELKDLVNNNQTNTKSSNMGLFVGLFVVGVTAALVVTGKVKVNL